jgi:hypothetical protein
VLAWAGGRLGRTVAVIVRYLSAQLDGDADDRCDDRSEFDQENEDVHASGIRRWEFGLSLALLA